MAQPGFGVGIPLRKYEDYESLKKHVHANIGRAWDGDYTYEVIKSGTTTTTGATGLEMLSIENGAVAFIADTEEIWVFCTAVADDTSADGLIITLVYKDQDGTEHTTYGTFSAADTTTETAFDPAVADGYCAISCTINGAVTTQDVTVGVTGMGTPMATISNTALAATEAQLFGIGTVYGKSSVDHAESDAGIFYLDYYTPWGEVKTGALCTLGADSDEEVRFIEADTTTYVKDFWREISLQASFTTSANTHEALIGDIDFNINGGGGDCYGCINELTNSANIMRVTAPAVGGACDMWLGKFIASSTLGGGATADTLILQVRLTPYGDAKEKTLYFHFAGTLEVDLAIRLEPDTNVTWLVADAGAASDVSVTAWYILAKQI